MQAEGYRGGRHLGMTANKASILNRQNVLETLRGGVVVSVQAAHGEPLDKPEYLCVLAESALNGGACAVRMAQVDNIRYFKQAHPDVVVMGITKPEIIPENAVELVYITPTLADVQALADCCDVVALDATLRHRPGGQSLAEIVTLARQSHPNLVLMADVATLAEGLNAANLGFDLLSTTLSGYTLESREAHSHNGKGLDGPDFDLLAALVRDTQVPVILEGRVWEPAEVTRAFELGAFAVVIGSAVTRPHEITRRFVRAATSCNAPAEAILRQ